MNVDVVISEQPLHLQPLTISGCGAVARFDGIVRGLEGGKEIAGLCYEAYAPMAEKVIRDILAELSLKHPCERVRVSHRIGFVPVGEAAIIMDVHSSHRGEAFALLQKFMDRLKQDVPIWKRGSR